MLQHRSKRGHAEDPFAGYSMINWIRSEENQSTIARAARTAVAAVLSLLVARLSRLPEAYWAALSTLIVMQSTLGPALPISEPRPEQPSGRWWGCIPRPTRLRLAWLCLQLEPCAPASASKELPFGTRASLSKRVRPAVTSTTGHCGPATNSKRRSCW